MTNIDNQACLRAYNKFVEMVESARHSAISQGQMVWLKDLPTDDLFSYTKMEKARINYETTIRTSKEL